MMKVGIVKMTIKLRKEINKINLIIQHISCNLV